jgi:hypothetical protein
VEDDSVWMKSYYRENISKPVKTVEIEQNEKKQPTENEQMRYTVVAMSSCFLFSFTWIRRDLNRMGRLWPTLSAAVIKMDAKMKLFLEEEEQSGVMPPKDFFSKDFMIIKNLMRTNHNSVSLENRLECFVLYDHMVNCLKMAYLCLANLISLQITPQTSTQKIFRSVCIPFLRRCKKCLKETRKCCTGDIPCLFAEMIEPVMKGCKVIRDNLKNDLQAISIE